MAKGKKETSKNPMKINLGINILRAIRLQNMTVKEWAEVNDFPLTNIHRIIRAEANPTLNNLLKISEKLHTSLPKLFKS